MAIPPYVKMLRPILALAAEKDITRKISAAAMADQFHLTPEERAVRNPSGPPTYVNRSGWAMTWLTKGGLISKVAPKTYRITDSGRKFLAEHPKEITEKDLSAIPGWHEAWTPSKNKKSADIQKAGDDSAKTPIEALDSAIATIEADVKSRLLTSILEQSAEFFEQLVLNVLLAMGYGGSREDAAEHLGKSGDEGIDGRINQDPLGLDQIVVQAKRYAPENVINHQTIQAFVGSMTGQGVSKVSSSRLAVSTRMRESSCSVG
jgi:restriction system protein